MASFTGVGDNVTLTVNDIGDTVSVALSGTYSMTIALEREVHPNAGAYAELKRWKTADATVAHSFVNEFKDQKYRLVVLVDVSGTATAALSNSGSQNLVKTTILDDHGDKLIELRQTDVRFKQAVVFDEVPTGDGATGGQAPANTTASTLAVTATAHAGRTVTLNRAGGIAVTLPAATGTGDVYTFYTGTTFTSSASIAVAALPGTDIIQGGVAVSTDAGGVTIPTAVNSDTITFNGSTTGGIVGTWIRLTDVATGVFMCEGFVISTGAEATPFSANVAAP